MTLSMLERKGKKEAVSSQSGILSRGEGKKGANQKIFSRRDAGPIASHVETYSKAIMKREKRRKIQIPRLGKSWGKGEEERG